MTQFARTTMTVALATALFSSAIDAGQGLTLERRVLSLAAARKIIAAAEAEATARGVGVVRSAA